MYTFICLHYMTALQCYYTPHQCNFLVQRQHRSRQVTLFRRFPAEKARVKMLLPDKIVPGITWMHGSTAEAGSLTFEKTSPNNFESKV